MKIKRLKNSLRDVILHENNTVQNWTERKLQNYKPYKYLYNQLMKKKITTLQTLQKIHGQKIVCVVFSTIAWKLQNYKPYKV